ncbi:MAG: transketolase [Dermatophilaceae bacterium]
MTDTFQPPARDNSLAAPVVERTGWGALDVRAVDTARLLAADAVQKVGNGHPGTAMALAPAAYLLYQNVMRVDPADPFWLGRDRFVLSNGHASLTQYVALYMAGIGLELDDLKALRTRGSLTPGHPELHHTTGVEITTGPLGSGLASAVGMAMAQRRQRGLFDPDAGPGESPFDHHIYVISGDGCLQEGVASEACSLAGHQQLGNMTLIYDDNRISIEDQTDVSFSEDVALRFEAYGWDVRHVDWRGHGDYVEDVDALLEAIEAGRAVTHRPTIIILSTIIAWPAPTARDTGKAHGAALGGDEIAATKKLLGFDPQQSFHVDDAVIAHTRRHVAERGAQARREWQERFEAWEAAHPDRADLLERLRARRMPEGFAEAFPTWEADAHGVATRAASGKVLTALADVLPELWGGSADLADSNNTTMEGQPSFIPSEHQTRLWKGGPYGRTLHFGVRENAMGMILSGIALEGLTRPYGGTFLTFSDYMRPAVRLAALQELAVVFVWTHDSVGLGEDGPTHQPIEQIPSLRLIPNLAVVRPGDANETAWAWRTILANESARSGPVGLLLSRQALPTIDRSRYASAEGVTRGAYVLADAEGGDPEVIIIATGSEVSVAVDARELLTSEGVRARVVSAPCLEWFAAQDQEYRDEVLPPSVRARVSVEAAHPGQWRDYVGDAGEILGIDHFGESASGSLLLEAYGFTPDHVADLARRSISTAKEL